MHWDVGGRQQFSQICPAKSKFSPSPTPGQANEYSLACQDKSHWPSMKWRLKSSIAARRQEYLRKNVMKEITVYMYCHLVVMASQYVIPFFRSGHFPTFSFLYGLRFELSVTRSGRLGWDFPPDFSVWQSKLILVCPWLLNPNFLLHALTSWTFEPNRRQTYIGKEDTQHTL